RPEARRERGQVRVALAASSGRPPQILAQALHLARQVAQARGGDQLARPSLAERDLEPVLLGARRSSGRHQALDLRVRTPRLVLERERDRPRRGVRLAQRLDLGGRRRQRLLGRPRPLPRLVHGLLAVQALAPARRLELLAQALLARGGRPELADELGVPLLLLVELGADTRQSLLGLLGARRRSVSPLRAASSAASTARSAARAATSPRSCSRSARSSVRWAAGCGSGGGAATGAFGASTGSTRAPRRRTASIISASSASGRSSVRTSRSANERGATATSTRLPTGVGPACSGRHAIVRTAAACSTSRGT